MKDLACINKKPIILNGKRFDSLGEAADSIGMSRPTMRKKYGELLRSSLSEKTFSALTRTEITLKKVK